MTDKKQTDDLDVKLNEAFERLENQPETPEPKKELNKESKKAEKMQKGQQPAAPVPPSKSSDSSSASPVNLVTLILALVAIGIGSYSVYMIQMAPAQVEQPTGMASDAALESVKQDLTRLKLEINKVANQTVESPTVDVTPQLNELREEVQATVSGLKAELGTTSEDWLLAEAEYLIRLANQRVLMEADAKGAIALFEAADGILRDAEGVSAYEVREALAQNIADLKAVADLDVTGIYLKLQALKQQVDSLQQKDLKFEKEPQFPDQPAEAWWLRTLQNSMARIASLVDYRRNGEVITPILPPDEEYYLRQNLVLKLQLAQLGLLRHNGDVYTSSLQEVADWVARHFDMAQPLTQQVVATAEELAKVNVSQQLPTVDSSSRAMRALMADFHQGGGRATP